MTTGAIQKENHTHFEPIVLIGSNDSLKNYHINFYRLILKRIVKNVVLLEDIINDNRAANLFDEEVCKPLYLITKIYPKFLELFKIFYQDTQFKYPLIISLNASKSEFTNYIKENKNYTVIECYTPRPSSLAPTIKKLISHYNLNLEPDAVQYLIELACLNPEPVFFELEKLSLFCLNKVEKIMIKDIQQICRFSPLTQLESALQGLITQDLTQLDDALPLSIIDNDQYLIIRVFIKFFQQMLDLHSRMKQNNSLSQNITQVIPFIFFTQKKLFEHHFKKWPLEKCLIKLESLNNFEHQIKKNSLDSQQVKQFLLMLIM